MYQNCCKKCGSISLHTEVKENNTGLYCDECGSWIKWLSKEELRAFEYNKQKDCSDIIKRLRAFTDYLEKQLIKRWSKHHFLLKIQYVKVLLFGFRKR